MGNTASSQRADFLQRDDRRFQQIVQERSSRPTGEGGETGQRPDTEHPPPPLIPRPSEVPRDRRSLYSVFRRQPTTRLAADRTDRSPTSADDTTDEQEESPLMMRDEAMRSEGTLRDFSTPVGEFRAVPLSRQASTMSRLGSRFLPDSVARGLLNSGEETPAEGQALRLGNSVPERIRPSVFERRLSRQNNNRFSLRESLRTGSLARASTRRHSIRGPFPAQQMNGNPLPRDALDDFPSSSSAVSSTDRLNRSSTVWRRRARLSRFRDSIALPQIFSSSTDRSSSSQLPRMPPGRPSRGPLTDDSAHLLPSLPHVDTRHDADDAPHELDAVEPEARNVLSAQAAQANGRLPRHPHTLRSRSTRLIRRGEQPPLSHVLQLAAAAIAAQLSGHANPDVSGGQPANGEVFDGSIQQFVQTLQDAATAQAGENLDSDLADGNLPPVNFLRVFQFPNTDSAPSSHDQLDGGEAMDIDDRAESADADRSVTLVLVGVRSMPTTSDGSADENGTVGPSLDTLLSLPFLPPTNMLRNGSSGALFRRSDGRSRFGARRNSMTNFSSFPAQYESQRHHRTRSTTSRSHTDQTSHFASTPNIPTVLSESPPGPHPPPSTPADARSGTVTPNRRPSSASAAHSGALPNLNENPLQQGDSASTSSPFTIARQRRRSDSEFARRPELSSGASRRNGMVEPDAPPPPAGRSWLIYVVGTNVSSDHPAFTMPSLFTDNPTYEDMQLLSTLLGPVKPPVATQEDLSVAGGVYRLVTQDGSLIAEPLTGSATPSITIVNGDRCLICLCDYEASEEIRQLNKCNHVYHRECIDEWLTTGRNSCPLCRGQGVDEKASAAAQPTATPAEVE